MDEVSKNWACGMYIKERTEILSSIENEKVWILGSRSKEEKEMHRENIRRFQFYVSYLNKQIAALDKL